MEMFGCGDQRQREVLSLFPVSIIIMLCKFVTELYRFFPAIFKGTFITKETLKEVLFIFMPGKLSPLTANEQLDCSSCLVRGICPTNVSSDPCRLEPATLQIKVHLTNQEDITAQLLTLINPD